MKIFNKILLLAQQFRLLSTPTFIIQKRLFREEFVLQQQVCDLTRSNFLDKKFAMQAAGAIGYQIVTSEEFLRKITSYKSDLMNGKATTGKHFAKELSGLDLSRISVYEFIQLLLSTKKPQIFAERDVSCDGTDWTSREFALLGDISVAVRVLAYDNGVWTGNQCTKHDPPLNVELLFTPGPMLNAMDSNNENNPDYKEVVENGKINQEKYNAFIERRLLPLFSYANIKAENEKKAFVVLPGIGCGFFAGKFRGQMESKLSIALHAIIEKCKFSNIKGIYLGFHGGGFNEKKEINGVIYEVRKHGLPQLSHPREFGEEFKDCQLYKVVAWDQLSLPGNDFFSNNSRYTDDGVSAAATNVMEIITGVKGTYRGCKYFPPKEYRDWEAVAKAKNVKLIANDDNLKIFSQDGQLMEI